MQKWLKLQGTDFNVETCSSLSFEDFKKEGENSFARGRSVVELKKTHDTLIAAAKTAPVKEITNADGNTTGPEKKTAESKGKGD